MASFPMGGRELWMRDQAPETAARNLLHGLLNGVADRPDYPGAWGIFRKVIAAWITDLDLGEIKRMELVRITDAEHDRLQKALGQTEKVSAVFARELDRQGISTLDVETRLDPAGLKNLTGNERLRIDWCRI